MEKQILLPSQPVASPVWLPEPEVVDVLGIPVACIDRQALIDYAVNGALAGVRRSIFYVNAHCLNVAVQDAEYHSLLNRADMVYSDGIGVVWAGKILFGQRLSKVTGADWIFDFCEKIERRGLRVYILAGKPGIVERAVERLEIRYPKIMIVGYADGYFSNKSETEVLKEVENTRPDVFLVGMGTPNQEKWIAANRKKISSPVCWAVGALFDYVAGAEPRAPAWINSLALEWFWRLLVDPKGKWKRYIFGNPVFIYRILRQKWLRVVRRD